MLKKYYLFILMQSVEKPKKKIFFSKIRWHKKNQLTARITRVLGCWPWLQVKRWKSKLNWYKWWNKIRINLEQNDDKRLAKNVHTSEKNKFIGSLCLWQYRSQLTGSCMVKWLMMWRKPVSGVHKAAERRKVPSLLRAATLISIIWTPGTSVLINP